MDKPLEIIELEVEPIPPDTIASAKSELVSLIEATLRDAGKEDLLLNRQIQVEVEKTFPTDAVIVVGLTLLTGIALETYKELILPALRKRFKIKQKSKKRKHKK